MEAFSRAQTQLQQDYHDAPIRAQIAGFTERPDPLADTIRNPTPVGPGSPAPQIFSQAANQALARHEARLRTQLQQDPSLGTYCTAIPHRAQQIRKNYVLEKTAAKPIRPGKKEAKKMGPYEKTVDR